MNFLYISTQYFDDDHNWLYDFLKKYICITYNPTQFTLKFAWNTDDWIFTVKIVIIRSYNFKIQYPTRVCIRYPIQDSQILSVVIP